MSGRTVYQELPRWDRNSDTTVGDVLQDLSEGANQSARSFYKFLPSDYMASCNRNLSTGT